MMDFLKEIVFKYSKLLGNNTELIVDGMTEISVVKEKIKLWKEGLLDFKEIMEFYYNA